jgi:hypothetical protein
VDNPNIPNLQNTADLFSNIVLTLLIIAGLVAVAIAAFSVLSSRKSNELVKAKDRQLSLDLKAKDEQIEAVKTKAQSDKSDSDTKIAELKTAAATATQKAAEANLAALKLRQQVSPRRLSGEQKAELTKLLSQYPDQVGIVIVSAFLDSESSDLADDLDTAITQAKWKTLRLKDRLTQKSGISLGVYEDTPTLDPWGRPILELKQRVGDALKAIGISYQ